MLNDPLTFLLTMNAQCAGELHIRSEVYIPTISGRVLVKTITGNKLDGMEIIKNSHDTLIFKWKTTLTRESRNSMSEILFDIANHFNSDSALLYGKWFLPN